MKKTLKIYGLILSFALTLQACDEGFEDLNKNPDAVSDPNAGYLFTKAQLDAINCQTYASHVVGSGGFVQHFSTYKDVPSLGDRYTWSQGNYPYGFFNDAYPYAVNEIGEVITAVKDDPESVNLLSVARIWRVFIMHRITDLHGDIPYSEAGQGYSGNIFTPKYDEQSFIYSDMLSELEEATAAFDASKSTFGNADLIYSGDIAKWKKFAYSLMLRLGMRLTKVSPQNAQTWVQKAIVGGVILSEADIAMMPYADGPQTFNRNPIANDLISNDYGSADGVSNKEGGKLAQTFISHLKAENDPRLGNIAVVWVNGKADTTASLQKGMPNGLIGGSAPSDFGSYSEPNPSTLLKYSAPYLAITDAEMYLLLAEAAVRGWYNGMSEADAYQSAIEASMKNWALYDETGEISDARIAAYLDAHPLTNGTEAEKLEQIHTEFWVSLFPNELEIYANWRRTGYPTLVPVNVPGNVTNGTIPRRMIYPPNEETLNGPNYQEAVDRIGGNLFTNRVWWDQ